MLARDIPLLCFVLELQALPRALGGPLAAAVCCHGCFEDSRGLWFFRPAVEPSTIAG
jgi:hypothetical protein